MRYFTAISLRYYFNLLKEAFVDGIAANVRIMNDKDNILYLTKSVSGWYVGPEKAVYKSIQLSGHMSVRVSFKL